MASKKTTPSDELNPWADEDTAGAVQPPEPKSQPKTTAPKFSYDLDGLMTDFPTAKELERFVYDETGYVLNLKGRANKLKYQVAMDTLNGSTPDSEFIGKDNPYMDKTEMRISNPWLNVMPRCLTQKKCKTHLCQDLFRIPMRISVPVIAR